MLHHYDVKCARTYTYTYVPLVELGWRLCVCPHRLVRADLTQPFLEDKVASPARMVCMYGQKTEADGCECECECECVNTQVIVKVITDIESN